MTFQFIANPTGDGMSDADFLSSALEQPMSLASTLWDQAKGGAVESFGLGTLVLDAQLPTLLRGPELTFESDALNQAAQEQYAGKITESQYKASPDYREGVPWQEGMTRDRAAALADQYDRGKVREFYASKRPVTAFMGKLAGSATDPINYIPVFGEAVTAANVARFGKIGGRAITSALDASANTAIASIASAPIREQLGDDVSFQSTVSQIAMAAIVGGAFGAIHGRFGRAAPTELRAQAEEKLSTLQGVQEARVALNDAIDGLVNDGDVNLSQASTGFAEKAAREAAKISDAFDRVRENPTGSVRDPLVHITPEDIEGAVLARGAWKNVNEAEVSKRGWGLVKIIWNHGPESKTEPPEFQIRKEDVTALPEVIRAYEPSTISEDGSRREWRIIRDGREVVYADSMMRGERHIVTAYVQRPDRAGGDISKPRSRPVPSGVSTTLEDTAGGLSTGGPGEGGGNLVGSSSEAGNPLRDTGQGLNSRTPDGQPLPASDNVGRITPIDNSSPAMALDPAVTNAAKHVGKPDNLRDVADQYRVNPETGDFPEMGEIEQLRAEGRISDEDIAALDEADETLKTANGYGEALKAFANCVI